ncbi:uncharacterized protein LOC130676434 [Microplitis mediator]|uniref:uncharacterized protein LOC130676434 n=1 Tax=Microplitis mediator TaxID=375433 RepID=UPI002555DF23|nr:uncharacterized protein LOC130676434 [Microplitis mediator]
MALSAKNETLKLVPWFSLAEWHQVYKQIYSNDTQLQTKGYETLLAWKARMEKLPVGVDCTLSLMQVCLRDRDWSPKINNGELPMTYENDLCLLYSTTIMKFLNHIANIGNTRHTSLFKIARQLKIPKWIVELRHNAAHGHELASIELLRTAANVLLSWVHDEYWTAEGQKSIDEQRSIDFDNPDNEETAEARVLVDLIELWIAVGLYMAVDYHSVSDLPDENLRDTLNDLKNYSKKSRNNEDLVSKKENNDSDYPLSVARLYLLNDVFTILSCYKTSYDKTQVVLNILFKNESFLPTSEFLKLLVAKSESNDMHDDLRLPTSMIKLWQPFIAMMHERKMLEALTLKLLEFVNSSANYHRRLCAGLWINSIAQGLIKIKKAQKIPIFEYSMLEDNKKRNPKLLELKLKEEINNSHPELEHALWLNFTSDIPSMFMNINFATDLAINANELTIKFIEPILDLVEPPLDPEKKNKLLYFIRMHTNIDVDTNNVTNNKYSQLNNKIYTIEDVKKITESEFDIFGCNDNSNSNNDYSKSNETSEKIELDDMKVRNTSRKLVSDKYYWKESYIGILPWQIDNLERIEPEDITPKLLCPSRESDIIPGIIDSKTIMSRSQVDWDTVLLEKKQGVKRKRKNNYADDMINKAIEIVKTKKQ